MKIKVARENKRIDSYIRLKGMKSGRRDRARRDRKKQVTVCTDIHKVLR